MNVSAHVWAVCVVTWLKFCLRAGSGEATPSLSC